MRVKIRTTCNNNNNNSNNNTTTTAATTTAATTCNALGTRGADGERQPTACSSWSKGIISKNEHQIRDEYLIRLPIRKKSFSMIEQCVSFSVANNLKFFMNQTSTSYHYHTRTYTQTSASHLHYVLVLLISFSTKGPRAPASRAPQHSSFAVLPPSDNHRLTACSHLQKAVNIVD